MLEFDHAIKDDDEDQEDTVSRRKSVRMEMPLHERAASPQHHQHQHHNRPSVRSRRKSSLKRSSEWQAPDGTLYDRTEQQQALHDAYYRSLQQAEIVLITGASGTGKTVLANTLISRVESDGGLFLRGKFDQHQHLTSSSPCFRAFQFYAKRVLSRGPEEAKRVKEKIEQTLGAEINALIELIPELAELLTPEEYARNQERTANNSGMDSSESSSSFEVDVSDTIGRVVSVYRRFLRACCGPENPLVLFMDDLQWADEVALAVMEARVYESKEESQNAGFLFLATCRGNEVSVEDELSVVLRGIEQAGTPITDIQVNNLCFDALADMISNVLHLPRAECLPLVEVVYQQTKGNAFFSVQYLRSLEEEGTLYQDGDKGGKWTWKEDALIVSLEETGKDDLIVQLLASKMKELPADAQRLVKVIACIGNYFTEEVLFNAGVASADQVLDALEIAEEKGVIAYDFDEGNGHFSHDKFQETGYSLIPDHEKAAFHLAIGRSLRQQLTPVASKKYVAIILNQLSAGIDEMTNLEEREETAHICLRAARKAGKASSFSAGSEYAELGIRLLERRNWRDQYPLSLDLFNSAAELAYCCGNHERVYELVKEVLEHARSLEDKLQAHITKVLALAATMNSGAAISYCIEILRRLGQPFPRKLTKHKLVFEYIKIKRKLARYTDDDILNLPTLTDQNTSAAMVFIHQLFPLVQQERFEYSPLVAFRLVHLTLKHGLISISSVAFAFLGGVLGRSGRVDEGYRYTQLSFRILEKHPSDHWMSRCLLVSCGTVLPSKEPLREILKPLMTGHRLGLKSGDFETGFICGLWNCMLRILVGDPLEKAAKRLLQLVQLAHETKQHVPATMAAVIHQLACNLMGQAKDPLKLKGEFIDEDLLLEEAKLANRTLLSKAHIYFHHLLAFYYDDYKAAESVYRANKKFLSSNRTPLPTFQPIQWFHEGLVATEMAWLKKRKLSVARNRLKRLDPYVKHCPENVLHKVYLLEAEILAVEGRHDDAMCKYATSIKYAGRANYISDEAVANEKTGRMLLRRDKGSQALPFFSQARDLYSRWGAKMKVEAMDDVIAELYVNGHGDKVENRWSFRHLG